MDLPLGVIVASEEQSELSAAEVEPEPLAEVPATLEAILIPPLLCGVLFTLGFIIYAAYTRRYFKVKEGWLGVFGFKIAERVQSEVKSYKFNLCPHLPLSPDEREILRNAENGHNQLINVMIMSLPAILGLVFCPLTLILHDPMTQMFWPYLGSQPDINEAIGCFLTPASMVYAINLGFAYSGALSKTRNFKNHVLEMSTTFREATKLCLLTTVCRKKKKGLILAIKEQLFEVIRLFSAPCLPQKFQTKLYKTKKGVRGSILSFLQTNANLKVKTGATKLDSFVVRKLLHMNLDIWKNADSVKLIFSKLSYTQWAFLLSLGYLTFIGVVFIQAQSAICNLGMCILTVLSISFLLYFISDFDDPFNGVYRINQTPLFEVLEMLDQVYQDDDDTNLQTKSGPSINVDKESGEILKY